MAGSIKLTQKGVTWEVDSSGGSLTLPVTLWDKAQGPVFITAVEWVSKTPTAGDTVTLQDGSANLVWTNSAPSTTAFDTYPVSMPDTPIFGLQVSALDSGTLMVWYK